MQTNPLFPQDCAPTTIGQFETLHIHRNTFLIMRRREFLTLLGAAVATWPLAARAQQSAMPIVGFVTGRSPEESARLGAAFRKGLRLHS
jgi:hypothetical protein